MEDLVHFNHHATSDSLDISVPSSASVNFKCNVYTDTTKDPVVTLYGHLLCWACSYQWFHLSFSDNSCHVYKGCIDISTLVPTYSRGNYSIKWTKRLSLIEWIVFHHEPFIFSLPLRLVENGSRHHINSSSMNPNLPYKPLTFEVKPLRNLIPLGPLSHCCALKIDNHQYLWGNNH